MLGIVAIHGNQAGEKGNKLVLLLHSVNHYCGIVIIDLLLGKDY